MNWALCGAPWFCAAGLHHFERLEFVGLVFEGHLPKVHLVVCNWPFLGKKLCYEYCEVEQWWWWWYFYAFVTTSRQNCGVTSNCSECQGCKVSHSNSLFSKEEVHIDMLLQLPAFVLLSLSFGSNWLGGVGSDEAWFLLTSFCGAVTLWAARLMWRTNGFGIVYSVGHIIYLLSWLHECWLLKWVAVS